MSNLSASQADPKKILMVAANPATSSVTGWPVGFWWAELTHPYWEFVQAGYHVELCSPQGGPLRGDDYSDPDHESGYSASDLLSLGFKHSASHRALLEDTRSLGQVDLETFDAVFLVGGQAPMFSFREDAQLHDLMARCIASGRPLAVVCHATCALLEAQDAQGNLLVKGRSWTGFTNAEERVADEAVGQRLQPFWIEQEARKIEDTNFLVEQAFRPFAVRDGMLITGQQQNSGSAAARLVIEALGH